MSLLTLTMVSLLAGAATGIGGLLGVLFRPNEKNLVLGLSFSSGIMFGVTFLMLIPASLKGGFYLCFFGFIIGALFLFLLDFVIPHVHIVETRSSLLRLGTLVAIGIAIHDLPEGFGIGSGYEISGSFGIALAISIALHNIPEGMAISIPLFFSGMSRIKAILVSFVAGIPTLVGALLAFFLLTFLSENVMYIGLAFAAGAMFYITVNELVPEAHKYGRGRLTGLGIMLGILVAFLLTRVGK